MLSTISSIRTTSAQGLCMSPTMGVFPRCTHGRPVRNSEQPLNKIQSWSSCCSLAVIAMDPAYEGARG